MTGSWGLPTQAVIEDRVYEIHTDFRDILELLRWLDGNADPTLDRGERWYVAMRLFYPDFAAMPRQDWPAPPGSSPSSWRPGGPNPPPAPPALWTGSRTRPSSPRASAGWRGRMCGRCPTCTGGAFLAGSTPSARGTFATVVAIRDKLRRGKKLEPWELDFYRTHRAAVDLRPAPDPAAVAEKQRLLARLGA